ncbi:MULTISPECIES: hypothetical protein [unclassified Leucobacter]|uniref:hypothetical protein n=1 Tax=unclassified Leucobacter TaxID=2621730 RepID=UPI00165D9120|nr:MULTISPECIES: hypothetical protein [unclassified Leucobacter]MBC9937452.1 hypothetical protein [Leucobacter sp. cx-87]
MSTPEVDPVEAGVEAELPHEPVVVAEQEVEVTIERSVRYGRILIGGAILGAALASLASVFFPIALEADYSMAQIMGFMLLIGAAIGLSLAGILSLILSAAAQRRRGTAVAIQSDVR